MDLCKSAQCVSELEFIPLNTLLKQLYNRTFCQGNMDMKCTKVKEFDMYDPIMYHAALQLFQLQTSPYRIGEINAIHSFCKGDCI